MTKLSSLETTPNMPCLFSPQKLFFLNRSPFTLLFNKLSDYIILFKQNLMFFIVILLMTSLIITFKSNKAHEFNKNIIFFLFFYMVFMN